MSQEKDPPSAGSTRMLHVVRSSDVESALIKLLVARLHGSIVTGSD